MSFIACPTSTLAAAPAASAVRGGARADSGDDVIAHLEKTELYREYERAFESTTGLPLAIRRVGALHSPLHGSKQGSPFCAVMAARNKSCAACLRLQQQVEERATKEACTLQCFAGLTESAVPIRAGERVLGFLQTGQVLQEAPSEAGFKKVVAGVKGLGADVDLVALKAAYMKTRVVSKTQYEAVVRLLAIFGQHLSVVSNQLVTQQSASEMPAITKARAYIAEHIEEEIALADVARAAGMSPFYFCKTFKRATGINFVDYVSRVRVERVKDLLLNPHMRVSEAAFAAGFQSLSQFNRTFRRVAGEAPSVYRDRLHGGAKRAGSHALAA